jgi:hypothetical protein
MSHPPYCQAGEAHYFLLASPPNHVARQDDRVPRATLAAAHWVSTNLIHIQRAAHKNAIPLLVCGIVVLNLASDISITIRILIDSWVIHTCGKACV